MLLVSTVQQSESAIRIHISPLFQISFPFRSPQSTEQGSRCYTVGSHQLSILYIVSTVYMCQSPSPNSSHTPGSPLGVHTFVLYVCVSISALQISSSVSFFQIPHISDSIWGCLWKVLGFILIFAVKPLNSELQNRQS